MTEEEKEELNWLKSIQKKFKKLIADCRWDCVELTETEYLIVKYVMNAKTPYDLPILVDERLVNHVIEKVKNKFSKINTKGL